MRILLKCLLVAAILVGVTHATAAVCGDYAHADGSRRYVFLDDGSANKHATYYDHQPGAIIAKMEHYRSGDMIHVRDRESGYRQSFSLTRKGAELFDGGDRFQARMPYRCATAESVRANGMAAECAAGQEQACCAQGDAQACLGVISIYQEEASSARKSKADFLDFLGSFNMYAYKPPLPPARLDAVAAMCTTHRTPELCRKSIDELWRAQRWQQAIGLLAQSCADRLQEPRCRQLPQLQALRFPPQPISTPLPCGAFTATGSALLSDLTFGDGGRTSLGLGASPTARVEDSLIKLRHDKGGDFVLAALDAQTLVGLDDYLSMAVFTRTAPPEKACTPPVHYVEVPLSTACGLDKDPKDCCAAGDTQGCNRLGNMAALNGQWQQAAQHYAQVCAAKVRTGCDNWVATAGRTGDTKGVEQGLRSLCEKDGAGTHVACDVLHNGELDKQCLLSALKDMAREIDAEAGAAQQPATRKKR